MMLVAGGPGQGSAAVFDIGNKDNAQLYRALFPGYRIVAFDNHAFAAVVSFWLHAPSRLPPKRWRFYKTSGSMPF